MAMGSQEVHILKQIVVLIAVAVTLDFIYG